MPIAHASQLARARAKAASAPLMTRVSSSGVSAMASRAPVKALQNAAGPSGRLAVIVRQPRKQGLQRGIPVKRVDIAVEDPLHAHETRIAFQTIEG